MTTSTVSSPLLDRQGAVEGEGADAGVAAHYGDPMREPVPYTPLTLPTSDLGYISVVAGTLKKKKRAKKR